MGKLITKLQVGPATFQLAWQWAWGISWHCPPSIHARLIISRTLHLCLRIYDHKMTQLSLLYLHKIHNHVICIYTYIYLYEYLKVSCPRYSAHTEAHTNAYLGEHAPTWAFVRVKHNHQKQSVLSRRSVTSPPPVHSSLVWVIREVRRLNFELCQLAIPQLTRIHGLSCNIFTSKLYVCRPTHSVPKSPYWDDVMFYQVMWR